MTDLLGSGRRQRPALCGYQTFKGVTGHLDAVAAFVLVRTLNAVA